jgi:hypothetical protein
VIWTIQQGGRVRTDCDSGAWTRLNGLKTEGPPCGGPSRGESSWPMRGWPQNHFLKRSLIKGRKSVKQESQYLVLP